MTQAFLCGLSRFKTSDTTTCQHMESLQDLEDLSRLGAVDDVLQCYMTELEHCTTNLSQKPSSPINFAPLSSFLGNVQLQPAPSSQLASTEQTQSSSGDSRSHSRVPQASLQPQRPPKGRSPEPDSKAVGPWVVSNRKVQKRYRERQKVRAASLVLHQAGHTASSLCTPGVATCHCSSW